MTTFRPRYANRARDNAPTIIPGTRATKPSSVEKRVARRQKVRAYGGAAAAAVVDCSSGKKVADGERCKNPGVVPPIGRIVSTRRTIPSLLERLMHFRANWAVLLDFSNCIFSRCRCRREDKNCLSSGAFFAYLHRPFIALFVLQPFGSFFERARLRPLRIKQCSLRSAKCNSQCCGRSTIVHCTCLR